MKDLFLRLSSSRRTWIFLAVAGLLLKLALFPIQTGDYDTFLKPWTDFIKENEYWKSLQFSFYNYTPSYIYLLVLVAKLGITPVYPIKLISVLFEYLLAYFVGRIAFLKTGDKKYIWISLVIVPLLPTVLINSSYWGQCDSIYSSFAMGSIYFLLKKKRWLSTLFLGLSFAFKMQAVMLLPFFFVKMLRGNIKWYHFSLLPAVYFISILPTWHFGRALPELLTVYLKQADNYRQLTMNFPNLYIWINNNYYDMVMFLGLLTVVLLTLFFGLRLKDKKYHFDLDNWVRLAFLSAITVPFFLPGMHERYMYLGDVLAVLYFLVVRKNLGISIGVISVSLYAYARCTRFNDVIPMAPAFFVYLLLIILLTIDFIKSIHVKTDENEKSTQIS